MRVSRLCTFLDRIMAAISQFLFPVPRVLCPVPLPTRATRHDQALRRTWRHRF